MWGELADRSVGGNEVWRLVVFFVVLLLSLAVGRLARLFIDRAVKRARDRDRELTGVFLAALAKPVVLAVFVLGLALWFQSGAVLYLAEGLRSALDASMSILTAVAAAYVLYSLVDVVDYYLDKLARRTEGKVDDILAPLVGRSVRITIAVLVILNVAQVVSGKNITTILAGLGVGGLAVALAGQDTIKNFFGSMVILGDKPFEIGDRVIIDGHDGPVESVGFRSTRIRTLSGHLVTVPNSQIVNGTVQNIGKRPFLRRVANITITYDTAPEKVRRAVEILKEILENHEGSHENFPPRVFFSEFSDCSLNILMIYWYHPPDYWAYMDFSERVNLRILEAFNEEGIEFAFPTQTVYLANDDRRQLALRMLREVEG
ncbi:MAG: mechanosensitive ion channel family protein [Lentisphaerae bacterium]|nr:mechanosensitive ion channel family protein [Lentisphaerota bacterium]